MRDLTAPLTAETQAALSPDDVLQLLKDGNERFLAGTPVERDFLAQVRQTAAGQYPMAAILGCIDSRVPHEIVFDKGVGDVFSARVAGNVLSGDVLGSLEFAVAVAGARLIVVLGHTACGAVKGACDHVELGHLTGLLGKIEPVVDAAPGEGDRSSANAAFVDAVAEANVRHVVAETLRQSEVLREHAEAGRVRVVGAMHDVATGAVTFLREGVGP